MKLVWITILVVTFKVISCEDGDANGRVINGIKAKSRQFPFFAQLTAIYPTITTEREYQICGSSIISRRHLLTSAHCMPQPNEAYNTNATFFAYAGKVRVAKNKSYVGYRAEQRIPVKRIVQHPGGYDAHDIAILELESPLEFTDTVQPIAMADRTFDKNVNIENSECFLAGLGLWGTERNPDFSAIAHIYATEFTYAQLDMMPNYVCNFFVKFSWYHPTKFFLKNHLCTMTPGGKASCFGDSGGPVFCRHKNGDGKYRLMGIPTRLMDVYCQWGVNAHARVSNFGKWVARNMYT